MVYLEGRRFTIASAYHEPWVRHEGLDRVYINAPIGDDTVEHRKCLLAQATLHEYVKWVVAKEGDVNGQ